MFLARVPGSSGAPRIVVSADPPSGWRDVQDHYRRRLVQEGALTDAASEIANAAVGPSLTRALGAGGLFLDLAAQCATEDDPASTISPATFLCPVDPPLYRDFMVFEEHFSFGYRWRGLPTPDVLYEMPVSYLGNPASFIGPGADVPWPHYVGEMDYELELGIVMASRASDLTPETALRAVLGVTILNDFSGRDIQRREMAAGLGPSKGKHFANAAGPWIATLDEVGDAPDLEMRVLVNGEERAKSQSGEMIWSLAEIVAWASTGEIIPAGSLLGTGTANGGSGVEAGRMLEEGDIVSLTIERLGTLTNRIGRRSSGWTPEPRPARAGAKETDTT